jgi:hypothetical protein
MSSELTDTPPAAEQGRVRWRRFAGMMLASSVVAGALVVMTAQGVLAANFAVSGIPFTVTSSRLEGQGFEQFATLDEMAPDSPNAGDTGGQLILIVSAIQTADLADLCQSIELGGTFVKITAGTSTRHVTAHTLVVDSDVVTGDATFTKMEIGRDASTLDKVRDADGHPVVGNIGVLGQQADSVVITNLRQNNFATTAGSFQLPNLNLRFSSTGC